MKRAMGRLLIPSKEMGGVFCHVPCDINLVFLFSFFETREGRFVLGGYDSVQEDASFA